MHSDTPDLTNGFLTPSTIETERLFLRPFQSKDWKDMLHYYSDSEAIRYTTRRTLTENETWQKVATSIGHWQIFGYGPYAIEHKPTQQVIGTTGPWFPIDWPSPEIKWALTRKYWGQGLATEAVKAVQNMAWEFLPDIAFISLIDSRNQASIRLAEKVGSRLESERTFRGGLWYLYRHPESHPSG